MNSAITQPAPAEIQRVKDLWRTLRDIVQIDEGSSLRRRGSGVWQVRTIG